MLFDDVWNWCPSSGLKITSTQRWIDTDIEEIYDIFFLHTRLYHQDGYGPLHLAVMRKELTDKDAIMESLVSAGAKVNDLTTQVQLLAMDEMR